jgi:predicted short-subunit dehydrogenase-like oxidoreductase (DUF2520 family)
MADIVLIGAGRLGTSLGRALAGKGHRIRALTCRRKESAAESRAIIGQGRALTDNGAAARLGTIIFLCLPDEELPRAVARLARRPVDWKGKTVFHTSGLLPARVLEPLRKKGALVASLHPGQAFPTKRTRPSYFRGVTFGLEGDRKAIALAKGLVRRLGGRAVLIREEAKPLYHAAFSFAGNFTVVLLDAAVELLSRAGIPRARAVRMLMPILQGNLRSVKKLDTTKALTGPLVRGDAASVEAHLEALGRLPQYSKIYRGLSLSGLEMARRRGLAAKKIRALRNRLEGKSPLPRARSRTSV